MQDRHTFVPQLFKVVADEAPNRKTLVGGLTGPRAEPQLVLPGIQQVLDAAAKFEGMHYGVIDAGGEVVASGLLTTKPPPVVATAVIGRHSHADSRALDDGLGLRHVFLVHRADTGNELHLFDLASANGTKTLPDQPIRAARCEAPCIVRVGTALLVVVAHEHATLSAAHVVDLAAEQSRRQPQPVTNTARFSFVLEDAAPVQGTSAPGERETQEFAPIMRGDVQLRFRTFRPTAEALGQGLLLGRYGRCDLQGNDADYSLSRIHALLFAMREQVYLADLGSTNGIVHEALGAVRIKHLEVGDVFRLGQARLLVGAPELRTP